MSFPTCVGGFIREILGLDGLPIEPLGPGRHQLCIVCWGPGSRGGSDWDRLGTWHGLLVVL
jgi:hypothetical protein